MDTNNGTRPSAAISGGRVVRDALRRSDGLRASVDGDGDATDHDVVDVASGRAANSRRDAIVLAAVCAIGLVVLAVTTLRSWGAATPGARPARPTASSTRVVDDDVPPARERSEIRVHVAGAVQRPGVYRFARGARGEDALTAAGGATPGAHVDGVNLAAELRDGQKLTVPAAPPAAPSAGSTAASDGDPAEPGGDVPLDLNEATPQQLDALPGVGPSTVERIVAQRQRRPFTSVRELLDIPGIGEARFAQLRDRVTV